jgi:DNA-binding transcriptional regulator GbsR (MarR family)
MALITPPKLIKGDLKRFEEKIVSFYQQVGDSTGLNSKSTRIFAYLQMYQWLTQKQLKILTHFSSSTISTTLQSFLQSGIVTREIGENARLGIYRLKSEQVPFVYTEFSEIIEELEKLDEIILHIQSEIKKFTQIYPIPSKYFIQRLNGFRNYIEAQRRAIKDTKEINFLPENITNLSIYKDVIELPDELDVLAKKFVLELTDNAFYTRNDSIANLIFNYIAIYSNVTQDFLVYLTGFSLSTISRTLNHFVKEKTIISLPKEYKQPRIYQLPSVSLSIINQILKADEYIFDWVPKFRKLRNELNSYKSQETTSIFLIRTKISQILRHITDFKPGSERLAKAKAEIMKLYQ